MRILTLILTLVFSCMQLQFANAAKRETIRFKMTKVSNQVYMLEGQGGNIGISVGKDGVFMVDDQMAPLTPGILKQIKKVSDQDVKFLINTHWHNDHTGGNENFGKMGTVLVAHDQVRKRLTQEQFVEALDKRIAPLRPVGLPVITFSKTMTFHFNGETIKAYHLPRAHTDGDSVIAFRKANVIHTGDIFFHRGYPFIDLSSGGSVDGVIRASEEILRITNSKTKIIPGHGPLATRKDLSDYIRSLKDIRKIIAKRVKKGDSLDEVLKENPLKNYDASLGQGFVKTELFTRIVYSSLSK